MTRLFPAVVLVFAAAGPAAAENWPQWRGPKNDGHSTETGIPASWSATENVAWKCPLPGGGASTPCVWGDKIFVTCQQGEEVSLVCVSTAGKVLWAKPLGKGKSSTRADEGNLATASCSTDGKLVFAFTGIGRLAAFDFEGAEAWGMDVQAKYGQFAIQFGIHQTPVLFKGVLYVQLLHRKAQVLVALDAKTGNELWKVTRKSDGKGESPDVYSSPLIWEGKTADPLLIVHGNDYCTAHKLTDGSEVWRVTELNPKAKYNNAWRAVSSPLVTQDLIIVPSCKRGVTVAIDPNTAKGDIAPGGTGELWRIPRDTPDVPSPLLVDGLVYISGEGGTLYCYDAKTGAPLYGDKGKGETLTNMRHRASPIYADGKIFVLGREGTCVVVKPGREFTKLATNKLPDVFTASPAVAGGKLYLRGFDSLWAVGK